ncbi:GAL1 [Candida oxycetoniae]|uniref:Galactokinase n=1 Tax=Candida oxycetoniae TaxID=497107 RepID=A0AAI9WYK4_9ASCO|nr:GAL1 [Candida oxycetoniae]KAI3404925.2 GAL1 [Candida oxycetoniae]
MSIVPHLENLSFYSNEKAQKIRYTNLASRFYEDFPSTEIEFFARSPGRVNIIGDHIDYNFFPVFPMAIEVDVVVAVSTNDSNEIVITNTKSDEFPRETIQLPSSDNEVTMNPNHGWANYFRCALIVAHKFLLDTQTKISLKGMKMCFDGTVPTGGGLSSSAAFCVASTLAILYASGITQLSKSDLTRITVVSEHYIGLNNGGMDQCASVNGMPGHAMAIHFKPELKALPCKFPVKSLTFLITNSLQVSNKHDTAPIHYNLRVVEMAIASDILAKKLDVDAAKDSNLGTSSLRSVMEAYCGKWDGDDIDVGISNIQQMIDAVEALQREGYTTDEVCRELSITQEELNLRYFTKFPVKFDKLKLYQRSKHVYHESLRVLLSLKLLQDRPTLESQFLMQFGQLMNDSQEDLDKLNESSNAKLNEICSIALQNGSFGSRVTGAGWGGSIVHLTTIDKVPTLTQVLTDLYYKREFPAINELELKEAIIDSQPAMGSCIVSTKILQ